MDKAFERFYQNSLIRIPVSDMIQLFKKIFPQKGTFYKINPKIFEDKLLLLTLKELCYRSKTRNLKIKSTWEEAKQLLSALQIYSMGVEISKRVIDFKSGVITIRIPYVDIATLLEGLKTIETNFFVKFKHFTFVPVPLYLNIVRGYQSIYVDVSVRYVENVRLWNAIGKITNLKESGYKELEESGVLDNDFNSPKSFSCSITRTVLRFLVGLEEAVVYRGIRFPSKLLNHPERDYVYRALCQLG